MKPHMSRLLNCAIPQISCFGVFVIAKMRKCENPGGRDAGTLRGVRPDNAGHNCIKDSMK
jgi:hypothetical protein